MNQTTALFDLDLHLGQPQVADALQIYPLTITPPTLAESVLGYQPGPSAAGEFTVDELDGGGSVPELDVQNHGATPLLLVEGETLVGGLQNRTLNVSVLIAGRSTARIPVSCVEAGRWGSQREASRSVRHSPARLRSRKTESVNRSAQSTGHRLSDQGQVWADVAHYATARGVRSESSALEDVHASAAADVEAMVEKLRPVPDQVGVVVAVSGRPIALEVFDDPATLAAYWDGLLHGYALDALDHEVPEHPRPDRALRFLRRTARATATRTPAVDLGEELHLESDRITGTGLTWNGRVRHLAAFRRLG